MLDDINTVHHVDGVPWFKAKLPRRWHLCRTQTWGFTSLSPYYRCPCGAIRSGLGGFWMDKNSRRRMLKETGRGK